MIEKIFPLLAFFQLKHFLCDYPLQTNYMLRKFELGMGGKRGFLPLLAHAGTHGVGTLLIVAFFAPHLWWLAGVDVAAHALIDYIKANRELLGRFNDIKSKAFWSCMGADQMMHHLCHYGLIYVVLKFGAHS